MEKKTIGGFIAALRKANGMTQRQLAELLHVSDKTVSRWERDDGTPDLSTIPVIAEIFGVSCDELLRGERKSPSQRSEQNEKDEPSPKSEKQCQRVIKVSLSKFQTLTFLSIAISTVGLITALICNLAFTKAILGFLIASIFFVASLFCQVISLNKAFQSVEDTDLLIDETTLSRYKRKVLKLGRFSIGLTVAFIGFTFPLIFVDAYLGLTLVGICTWGSISTTTFTLMYVFLLHMIEPILLKNGVYVLTDKEQAVYNFNRSFKRKCAAVLALLLLFTGLFQAFGTSNLWSPNRFSSSFGTAFNDFESFKEYMEKDVDYNGSTLMSEAIEIVNENEVEQWYDENGNPISEEEAFFEVITDKDENVLCEYIHRNQSVTAIYTQGKGNEVLPIVVVTHDEYRSMRKLSNAINTIYCVLYPIEILAVVYFYLRKKER